MSTIFTFVSKHLIKFVEFTIDIEFGIYILVSK